MYYVFIVNVNCYSTKIKNFANELIFQAFRRDLILQLETKSAKFNTPKILSHLFYPNLMIDVSMIYD